MSCEKIDKTVLIIHSASSARFEITEEGLEFAEEDELLSPVQRQLKHALAGALGDYARFRKMDGIEIEACACAQFQNEFLYPFFLLVRLRGQKVTVAHVQEFKAAAQSILSLLVPQMGLDDKPAYTLGERELDFLVRSGKSLASRFAGKSIRQGIMVRFGSRDLQGFVIQGPMPTLTVEQEAVAVITAIGKPMGFDEPKGTAAVWIISQNGTDDTEKFEGRVDAQCHDLGLLRVMARAYANRNFLKLKVIVQLSAGKKKKVMTIMELEEVAAEQADEFELLPNS